VGFHVSQLFEPSYRTAVRKMLERTLDAQVQTMKTVDFLTKEGRNLPVALGVHPIYKEGKTTEVQGIANPLTNLTRPQILSSRDAHNNPIELINRTNGMIGAR
jgi:PAS domain S-box-containing protein